jgi:DNA processing protein
LPLALFDDPPAPAADPADPDERRALVALSLIPGVGAARVRAMLARFGSACVALAAPARRLAAVDGVGPQTASAVVAGARDALAVATSHFRAADRAGHTFVGIGDPVYPALLRRLYDPPPYLWVRGRLCAQDERAIALVGTRRATDYGRRVAEHFAAGFAANGLTVVSGLAYGIDIAAHRAALDAGGRTVAVLGSGVDRIYPARHAPTVRRIIDHDQGAVVSEFPPGTAPDAVNFPRRNRVVAGLSVGVLVAEARTSGGALLTAMAALEQNREVFAAPAPLFSEMDGTNRLIRDGAQLVTRVEDVIAEISPILGLARDVTVDTALAPDDASLTPPERALLDVLGPAPRALEEICEAAGLDASTALVYLLQLEFRGLARQMAGKRFQRG